MADRLPSGQFPPGVSGNPGGLPKGTRARLTTKFVTAMLADFHEHGEEAIRLCRVTDPVRYVQIIANMMPKQVEASQPLDDLNDEQLTAAIAFLRSRLAESPGDGISPTGRTQ